MHFATAKNILGQVETFGERLPSEDANDLVLGVDEIMSALPIQRTELEGKEEEILLAVLSGSTPRQIIKTGAVLKLARVKSAELNERRDDQTTDHMVAHLHGDTVAAINSLIRMKKEANDLVRGTPGNVPPATAEPEARNP